MIKTCIYALGILALAYTDISNPSTFFHLFLPFIDLVFIIFIACELFIYFSAINFSGSEYNIYDLLRDMFYLREDISQIGFASAIIALFFSLLDMVLLFSALFYALKTFLNIATLS